MSEIKCPYCNGDTIKSGKLPSGRQRYTCKVCKKGFSTGAEIIKPVKSADNEFCPYCGGKLKYRGWNNSGTRRYKCTECGKSCSGTTVKLPPKQSLNINCPYCNGTHIVKGGSLKDGSKRYVCRDCGKGFSEKTVVKEQVTLQCPKCGNEHINRSGHDTKTGKQRYKCIECGYKFVEEPTQFRFKIHEKQCPRCEHIGAKKGGKSNGKQYYICLECGHKYLEGGKYKQGMSLKQIKELKHLYRSGYSYANISKIIHISEKTIGKYAKLHIDSTDKRFHTQNINNEIKKLILQGNNVGKVAFAFNYKKNDIDKFMKKHYQQETISSEQYNNIVKFGVGCSVPINYLAPYIKCSEHKCEQILSQYKIKKIKIKPLTDLQKAQDKFELDRFIK